MSPAAEILLPHYRVALAEAVRHHEFRGCPLCESQAPDAWARLGETAGWLDTGEAIRIRRLADKVRFYEERSGR
ncbi:MAG: hypothetical protein ACHQXA_04745 [Gemmatimonadales bacterium]